MTIFRVSYLCLSHQSFPQRGLSLRSDENIDHADDANSIWNDGLGWRQYGAKKRRVGRADWKVRQFGSIRVDVGIFAPLQSRPLVREGTHPIVSRRRVGHRVGGWSQIRSPARDELSVADGAEPHRSHTKTGAKLFVVD